jgi:hypothetical protein
MAKGGDNAIADGRSVGARGPVAVMRIVVGFRGSVPGDSISRLPDYMDLTGKTGHWGKKWAHEKRG